MNYEDMNLDGLSLDELFAMAEEIGKEYQAPENPVAEEIKAIAEELAQLATGVLDTEGVI